MGGARLTFLLIFVTSFDCALLNTLTGTDAIPAELKVDAGTLPKSCKGKFYSAASLPSDPEEMKTYIVLLRRYSTSRAALRVAATLERLARNTSGVRLGELSVMDSGGEPSLVVETTVAGLRVLCQFSDVALIEEDQIAVSDGAQAARGGEDKNYRVPYHLDRVDQRHLPLDGKYRPDGNGSGVEIFVFDSGIRYNHEEFGGRALFSGYDPIDQLFGQNYRGSDCYGHGTSVASCAVGRRFGTAPGAVVRSMRIMTCEGHGLLSFIYKGLLKLIEMKEKDRERKMIASLSLIVSTGKSYSIDYAVKRVHLAGIPVVVAAGNFKKNACLYSPASSPYTITVGGSTSEDKMFDWNTVGSNYGPCVDIFAPATSIMAAHYTCRDCSRRVSGTSYAVPLVSGLVAILLEQEPHLNASQVMKRIKELCTRDTLQFAEQQKQDGTPNCLAYTPKKAEEAHENTTADNDETNPGKNLTTNENMMDKDRQGDPTHNGNGNQTSDSKDLSGSDDQRSDNDNDNNDQKSDDKETSDKDVLDNDDQKSDKDALDKDDQESDDKQTNDKDELDDADKKSDDKQSGDKELDDMKNDTDSSHNLKASTEIPSLVTTSTPVRNQQPGPDYMVNLNILASDLQQVLMKKMNDGYIPTYVSNNKEASTGWSVSFIAIFKKTPMARDCKLLVNRHAWETRKMIKMAKKDGYVVTMLHSYVVQGRRRLRFLAVLEPNKTALNFTSFLQYRVRPKAVEAAMRKISAKGYTISSMTAAFCGLVRPAFTLFSEQFGPEKDLNLPKDAFVLQMDIEGDKVINMVLHFRQKGYFVKDIDTYGGCGNGTLNMEVKHSLLFHRMSGASSDYVLKFFHSTASRKKVEDSLQTLGKRFGVNPVMAVNTGKYYIVQFKPL